MNGIHIQDMKVRYTDRGTLLITTGTREQRELTSREAADLLTYLFDFRGDLFTLADEVPSKVKAPERQEQDVGTMAEVEKEQHAVTP